MASAITVLPVVAAVMRRSTSLMVPKGGSTSGACRCCSRCPAAADLIERGQPQTVGRSQPLQAVEFFWCMPSKSLYLSLFLESKKVNIGSSQKMVFREP